VPASQASASRTVPAPDAGAAEPALSGEISAQRSAAQPAQGAAAAAQVPAGAAAGSQISAGPAPATAAALAGGAVRSAAPASAPPVAAAARPPVPPAPVRPQARASQRAERPPVDARAGGARVSGNTASAGAAAPRSRRQPPGRSSTRSRLLIGAGALVAIGAVALLANSLLGSSGTKTPSTTTSNSSSTGATRHHRSHVAGAARPADVNLVVLNGTETNGLAHHLASQLQQLGFTRATPLGARPPGAAQVTTVQYASGKRADAQEVARALSVNSIVPMEAGVSSVVGSPEVVVIVGADRAAAG